MLDLAAHTVTQRYVDYNSSVPFIATREAGIAPRVGLATLAGKLRSLVDL